MTAEMQPRDFINRSITATARQLNCTHAPVFLLWDGQTLVWEEGKNMKWGKKKKFDRVHDLCPRYRGLIL